MEIIGQPKTRRPDVQRLERRERLKAREEGNTKNGKNRVSGVGNVRKTRRGGDGSKLAVAVVKERIRGSGDRGVWEGANSRGFAARMGDRWRSRAKPN